MADLAQAYVQILPSTRGMLGNLNKEMGGQLEEAGNSGGQSFIKTLGGVVAKGVAALGIGKMISSSLTAGADLEQSIGGIETLFGDAADKMKGYAQEAFKTAGVSANDYMQNVTSFSATLIKSQRTGRKTGNGIQREMDQVQGSGSGMGQQDQGRVY